MAHTLRSCAVWRGRWIWMASRQIRTEPGAQINAEDRRISEFRLNIAKGIHCESAVARSRARNGQIVDRDSFGFRRGRSPLMPTVLLRTKNSPNGPQIRRRTPNPSRPGKETTWGRLGIDPRRQGHGRRRLRHAPNAALVIRGERESCPYFRGHLNAGLLARPALTAGSALARARFSMLCITPTKIRRLGRAADPGPDTRHMGLPSEFGER